MPKPILASWARSRRSVAQRYERWQCRGGRPRRRQRAHSTDPIDGDVRGKIVSGGRGAQVAISPAKPPSSHAPVLAESAREARAGVPGADRRLGRSHRLERHAHQAAIVKPGDFAGNYIHYGVREHGMAAAMNGMALHGGIVPYGGTFLVFTDYCRPSIRLRR